MEYILSLSVNLVSANSYKIPTMEEKIPFLIKKLQWGYLYVSILKLEAHIGVNYQLSSATHIFLSTATWVVRMLWLAFIWHFPHYTSICVHKVGSVVSISSAARPKTDQ